MRYVNSVNLMWSYALTWHQHVHQHVHKCPGFSTSPVCLVCQVLNVASDATQDEIKKAYRKSCLLLHPDKNPGDQVRDDRQLSLCLRFHPFTTHAHHTHTFTHTYIHTQLHTCAHTHAHTHTHTHTLQTHITHTHTRNAHAHTHTHYTHTQTRKRAHTTLTHTHAHTRTHRRLWSSFSPSKRFTLFWGTLTGKLSHNRALINEGADTVASMHANKTHLHTHMHRYTYTHTDIHTL